MLMDSYYQEDGSSYSNHLLKKRGMLILKVFITI